jgi:organic radical activating enzyme
MLNQQAPEPTINREDGAIDLHSMFFTIQGEGPFSGQPAFFIRLAGCNLQCPGCDTEYTKGREVMSLDRMRIKLYELIQKHKATTLVVITGGEPLRQRIDGLCEMIVDKFGLTIQIESNGVLGLTPVLHRMLMRHYLYLICSPKTSRIHPSMAQASAFKYVLQAGEVDEDGLPLRALGHKASPRVARPPSGYIGSIYVNPMDEDEPLRNLNNLEVARDSALVHGYRLGIQIHKLVELP